MRSTHKVAARLRVEPPPTQADELFVVRLAALAAASVASTPAPHPMRSTVLRLAAATAGAAVIATGGAYAADQLQAHTTQHPAPTYRPSSGPDQASPSGEASDSPADRTDPARSDSRGPTAAGTGHGSSTAVPTTPPAAHEDGDQARGDGERHPDGGEQDGPTATDQHGDGDTGTSGAGDGSAESDGTTPSGGQSGDPGDGADPAPDSEPTLGASEAPDEIDVASEPALDTAAN